MQLGTVPSYPKRCDNVWQLWYVSESTRRQVIERLFEVCPPPSDREVISVAEIAEFAKIPQVTIGSPSVSHSLMPNRTKEKLRKEINDFNRDIDQ
jgi:hypothetical protein